MSVTHLKRLMTTGVVSSALAVGALAAAPGSASATTTTTATYTCASTLPIPFPLNTVLLPSFTVPATFSIDTLPDLVTANVPVPAGVPVVGTLDLNGLSNAGLGGLLTGLTPTLQGQLNTVLGTSGLGTAAVPIDAAISQFSGGVATVNGTLGSFNPSSAGDLPIPVPTSFDLGLAFPVLSAVGYHCTLDNAAATAPIATLHVSKAGSSVKSKVITKKVHQGSLGKVKVTVKTAGTATGKVVAKLKGKTIGQAQLKNGRATLKLKKLRKLGVNKVKLIYSGSASSLAATKTIRVTVVR